MKIFCDHDKVVKKEIDEELNELFKELDVITFWNEDKRVFQINEEEAEAFEKKWRPKK